MILFNQKREDCWGISEGIGPDIAELTVKKGIFRLTIKTGYFLEEGDLKRIMYKIKKESKVYFIKKGDKWVSR
jgi:hypothetical protein